MKKIFLVLALGVVLSLGFVAITSAAPQTTSCTLGTITWGCDYDDATYRASTCGTTADVCVRGALISGSPSGTSGIEGPKECVTLTHSINIKIKDADNNLIDATFDPGTMVCPQKTAIVTAPCYTTTVGKCFAQEAGMLVILNTIFTVTDWLFYIITLVVVLMVIYGGFVILTASGDPEKAGKGRSILTYAIIGLAVALLARIIPSVVQFIMGV